MGKGFVRPIRLTLIIAWLTTSTRKSCSAHPMKNLFFYLAVSVSLLFFTHSIFAQGSLTPPGAPALTMKSLDQIEPRTPVDASHTPGNFFAQFIINQPGSYYLTSNIVGVSGKRGIQIQTGNVTLDLNGFSLLGVSDALDAIYFTSVSITNLLVRNGIISGWISGSGIYYLGKNGIFESLNISANNVGIVLGDGSRISRCTVIGNSQTGIKVFGSACVVIENNCAGNNLLNNSTAAGIYVIGSGNRIEGNHVSGSGTAGYGIYLGGSPYTNNIVVRNSVTGVGTNNYSFDGNQIVGPLITNRVSGIITNSNPWANFSF